MIKQYLVMNLVRTVLSNFISQIFKKSWSSVIQMYMKMNLLKLDLAKMWNKNSELVK